MAVGSTDETPVSSVEATPASDDAVCCELPLENAFGESDVCPRSQATPLTAAPRARARAKRSGLRSSIVIRGEEYTFGSIQIE